MTRRPTPFGAVARGLAAGVIGTAAMTVAQELSSKLRSGGDGEPSAEQPQDPWEQAPPPAKIARRIAEGVFRQEVSAERIPLLTNAMHWGYGTGWGAVYGLGQGSLHAPAAGSGLVFGTGVWLMSYVQLVPMGLYEPPWKYPATDLATELGYHLVYGLGVAGAFRALAGR
jgi:uncharacterized membrane protein YagU involved in acid resistance